MSLSFRYLKSLNLKESKLNIFLSSIWSEFQSLALAFWNLSSGRSFGLGYVEGAFVVYFSSLEVSPIG